MSTGDTFPFQDRPYPERMALSTLVVLTTFGIPWLALICLTKLAIRLFA